MDGICSLSWNFVQKVRFMLKYNWKYGENERQKYYDVTVDGNYMCVYANKWQPDIWIAIVKDRLIHDKTANDRQREKQGLPKGCSFAELHRDAILCNKDPNYMMKKAEWCYIHNVEEISR